jgi:hypothetical protein
MSLMKRMMWPKHGDEVTIVRNGRELVSGHVIYTGDDSITVFSRDAKTVTLRNDELSQGIDDGSIVVKKKTGRLG